MTLVNEILSVVQEYARPRMRRHVQMPASFPFPYIDYNAKVGVCWLRLYRSADGTTFIAIATDLSSRLYSEGPGLARYPVRGKRPRPKSCVNRCRLRSANSIWPSPNLLS